MGNKHVINILILSCRQNCSRSIFRGIIKRLSPRAFRAGTCFFEQANTRECEAGYIKVIMGLERELWIKFI